MDRNVQQSFDSGKSFEELCQDVVEGLSGQNYAVVDNFLLMDEAQAVRNHIELCQQQGKFKPAGIGTAHQFQVKDTVRKDHIYWINPVICDPVERILVNRVRALMLVLNRQCFLGLKDFEMHFAIYEEGAFYKRHLDQFKGSDHRRLTFILYLNPRWTSQDGGILRMYLAGSDGVEAPFDILPLAGRLVCFRSDIIEHEVLISHKPRYSVTGWMLDQINELTFLQYRKV